MVLGSHTENHLYMSNIPYDVAKKEIKSGLHFLEQFTDKKIFAFPYGGQGSYNKLILNHVKKIYDFSFIFNPKDINKKNLEEGHAINRYDCNSFRFGSCFKFNL